MLLMPRTDCPAANTGLAYEPSIRDAMTAKYRFLVGLRLRLQLRAIADGKSPSQEAALSELTGLERSRLKDSFRAIKAWQEKAAYHYQTDFL